ncbi:MAG: hypothetical protein JWN48_3958 [Myxococcaceae bacterium]|nr:hypothetical protein [Myxococcaceae bacterium]
MVAAMECMPFRPRSYRGVSFVLQARRIVVAMTLLLAACSHPRSDDELGGDGGVETPLTDAGKPVKKPVDACPTDNPYCKSDAGMVAAQTCGNQPIDLAPVGVNVMVAIEGSAPMAVHWPRVQDAVKQLRDNHPESAFGLQIFWGELVTDVQSGVAKSNWCGATQERVLDVGDHSTQALLDFLGAAPPGPSYVGGLFATSPVIEPLNYYLENATKLADPTRTNYLVFVTGGNDNCFGSVYASKVDKLLAYQKLAVELGKQNIRIIPVGFDASNGGASGSGIYNSTPSEANLEALSALLQYGGSGLTEVPKVDDPSKLADVIDQVGQTVRNCRFSIPAALDPTNALNPFELTFAVNGSTVLRDRKKLEGWNFVEGNTTQVELFGKACQAVRAKAVLEARKSCAGDVCGSAAIKVETKPRAVLHLLDSSASRISCTDGGISCLSLPDSAGRTVITYWETVQHALGQSLIAPINDDIEFGIQFFPGKTAASFSCDVAALPEIAPAQGTEISIMSQMLEKLPFGFSPVVQVLENVAAAPGRLADPAVQGSVVMLTDGGDNCSGGTQDEIVARLGAAAKKLFDAGVKTYVVRYGAQSGKGAEQEAQLRAIVANGGTASSDPADPALTPYIDAVDEMALNAALDRISNSLATCSFAVEGLSSSADKSQANLYLNGEVIPFDGQAKKQEGWGWTDATQSSIEMYGEACTEFKNNRKTSVIVEFGCAAVLVI